jgi:hypothetical protein
MGIRVLVVDVELVDLKLDVLSLRVYKDPLFLPKQPLPLNSALVLNVQPELGVVALVPN